MTLAFAFPSSVSTPRVIPHNLDEHINERHLSGQDGEQRYRWYLGADAQGVAHVFRFPLGGELEQWQQSLRSKGLVRVDGPFRAKHQALLSNEESLLA